jgi:hypothetical protein
MKSYNWFPHYTSWLKIYGREIGKSDIIFNRKRMTEGYKGGKVKNVF